MNLKDWDSQLHKLGHQMNQALEYFCEKKIDPQFLLFEKKFKEIKNIQGNLERICESIIKLHPMSVILDENDKIFLHWSKEYVQKIYKYYVECISLSESFFWTQMIYGAISGNLESSSAKNTLSVIRRHQETSQKWQDQLNQETRDLERKLMDLHDRFIELQVKFTNREAFSTSQNALLKATSYF